MGLGTRYVIFGKKPRCLSRTRFDPSYGWRERYTGGLEDLAGRSSRLGAQEKSFSLLLQLQLFQTVQIMDQVGPLHTPAASLQPIL